MNRPISSSLSTAKGPYDRINRRLSLQPLVMVLRKMVKEKKPGASKLYQALITELESKPDLLQPMKETSALAADRELVEALLSTIFPPSTTSNQGIYAVTVPFGNETVYASPVFCGLFLKKSPEGNGFSYPELGFNLKENYLSLAFDLILKKFYNHSLTPVTTSVRPYEDEQQLTCYYEVKLNAQFVDVELINHEFNMPAEFNAHPGMDNEALAAVFPLEHFRFDGLMVVEVADVTQEQVILEIKNALLNINSFSDVSVYDELQNHIQSLIGLKNVQIGITPFFEMNGYYLYTEALYKNSLLFKTQEVIRQREKISEQCQEILDSSAPILYEILNEASTVNNPLLRYYFEQGAKSLILCPLKKDDGELIGLLEILSLKPGQLQLTHLARIQGAIPLFTLALGKSGESLELQIDKMIKEHFTAVQPAVEWKFTEAAFEYLQHREISELAKMPLIMFEDVYPLYAAIDVRNSSTIRSQSIQQDLLEQLQMARTLLQRASRVIDFPLLKESQYRIDKFIASVSETLLSDDELVIYEFLQQDLDAILRNLRTTKPELKKLIDEYFSALDPQRNLIYHHRKDYEESITRINDVLDRFIDNEQQEAQEVYPHYFERYVTDGIEFNIYVGQSLSPHTLFNELFVRNLKLWQLTLLVKAARITAALEKRLAMPLQTTQLILAHSLPLTISFRRKERKFDVDGAYNIRYEIVKKRIDKVHIKDSEERLTQPGTVAIVYSQHRELEEYMEFIEFLQSQKLLAEEVEHLELEDTQGISGLKAVRVQVTAAPENGSRNEQPATKTVEKKQEAAKEG